MDKPEEKTVTVLRKLFTSVVILQQIEMLDILIPEMYYLYEKVLQDAYCF